MTNGFLWPGSGNPATFPPAKVLSLPWQLGGGPWPCTVMLTFHAHVEATASPASSGLLFTAPCL